MEEIDDGSDRLRRSVSVFLGRSRSSRSRVLLGSSISSECARTGMYEQLPKSTRTPDKPPCRERRVAVWRLLSRHALARKESAAEEGTKKAKEKSKSRWSSWLPDPNRRWPVQGW